MVNYFVRTPRNCIIESFSMSENILKKNLDRIISNITKIDFQKINSVVIIVVQVDETTLNYKCKSHRGRSPENRTDAMCIFEFYDKIIRFFATCIQNESTAKILAIIFK